MNTAVLEIAQQIADDHALTVRDVVSRFRRAGVQFRTETTRSFDTEPRDENILLGYSFEGYFYPYNDDDNKALLEKLVLEARSPKEIPRPDEPAKPEAAAKTE